MIQLSKRFALLMPLGALAFAGCGGSNATDNTTTATTTNTATTAATSPDTSSGKVSDKPFRVAFNQWIGHSGIFLARDKGYFKQAGLNVEFKQFAGPADVVPPMLSGQLEVALTTADTPILLSRQAGENAMQNVMVTDSSNGADGVVAGPGIKTMSDLKGKTVAVTKGQVNEFLLLKALQSANMSESDVTVTNMDADTGGAAVLAGKVPAAVTWEPWLSKAAGKGGSVVFSSAQVPDLLLDIATVTQQTLRDRPADVRAFVAACLRGNEEVSKNPAEGARVAEKYLGATRADAMKMLTRVKLYSLADNYRLIGTKAAPGPIAKTSDQIAQFFVTQKVMTEPPAQTNLFTPDYLPSPSAKVPG